MEFLSELNALTYVKSLQEALVHNKSHINACYYYYHFFFFWSSVPPCLQVLCVTIIWGGGRENFHGFYRDMKSIIFFRYLNALIEVTDHVWAFSSSRTLKSI